MHEGQGRHITTVEPENLVRFIRVCLKSFVRDRRLYPHSCLTITKSFTESQSLRSRSQSSSCTETCFLDRDSHFMCTRSEHSSLLGESALSSLEYSSVIQFTVFGIESSYPRSPLNASMKPLFREDTPCPILSLMQSYSAFP